MIDKEKHWQEIADRISTDNRRREQKDKELMILSEPTLVVDMIL